MQPYQFAAFLLALTSLLYGCYVEEVVPGPPGPQGPPGFDGRDGAPGTGLMYETAFDLNADNGWQAFYSFPVEDEIFLEDVVLVYLLSDQIEPEDGGDPVDVWQLMPVSYFYEAGQLQIGYDFTATDVRIFAQASFLLDPDRDAFENSWARIVVVPADYSVNARTSNAVDFGNYEAVSEWLGLPESHTRRRTPFLKTTKK